ncbi:hypothetical protein [Paraflavitalea speifideaquila]|uniref:hypothetical protein n=1 Tax=Paraflavitalea speifideaquila TaxID=3076558 RepID=UPI0028E412BB|nr:hypothetical protein [Paraflavitalea speifideiaquila]
MSTKNGVDYLMRFTRYAFLFETDSKNFGTEKRLSPEQTLFYEQSDCEDRVALFFYLVKEIYNLPMIVLAYPKHVTIAVQFDKPRGKSIVYNGNKYSICEPTPQKKICLLATPWPACVTYPMKSCTTILHSQAVSPINRKAIPQKKTASREAALQY